MLHTRFKAESPVLSVGSCHGTQPKLTGLSALPQKPNLDKPAACRAPTTSTSTFSECLIQLRYQIFLVFDSYREANQSVGNSNPLACLGRDRCVRHGGRMG